MTSTHALTKVTTLSEDDVFRLDLDPNNSAVAETQRGITAGDLLGNGLTQAESDLGLTKADIDIAYDPGDVRRYGDNTVPGTTDMTTALQNAIDATAGGNGVVTWDDTLLVSSSINPKDRTYISANGYDSVLKLADGADVPVIQFSATNLDYVGVVLENFRINGNVANQTDSAADGIFLSNATGTSGLLAKHRIRDIWIENCKGSGLHLGFAMRDSVVENITVYKADEYGIRCQSFSDSIISSCNIGQSGKDGFFLSGCGNLGLSDNKSWFSGRLDSVGDGYYIDDCNSFFASNLTAQNNEGNGFYIIGDAAPIIGLAMSSCLADGDNKSAGGFSGMEIKNVAQGNIQLTVRGDNPNGTPDDGLLIDADTVGCVIDLTCESVPNRPVTGAGIGNNEVRVNGNELHMIKWHEDFVGDVIADQWANAVGTDPQVVAPSIVAGAGGGICRLVTGDDAAGTMAVNGVQLDSSLQWRANQYGIGFNAYLKLSAITDVVVFVGFTDQVGTLEMPFTLGASDILTSNASDAVGFLFDTGADTDNWWAVGVAANVDATHQDTTIAPVAGTAQRLHFVMSNAGAATFFIDGVRVGTNMTGAVTATTELTPVVAAFSRGAASRNIDVDAILLKALRT